MALPLLGATAAQAADTGTWNKVAICETGGLWSANTGNGFFGGLAVTQTTWDQYGGDQYAPRPDLASISQQIAVAERILADLGPDAWPGCEDGTGLLKDTAPPQVDPGGAVTPVVPVTGGAPTVSPTAPADGSGSAGPTTSPVTGSGTGSPSGSGSPTAPTTAPGDPGDPTTPAGGSATDPGAPTGGTPSTAPGAPSTSIPGSTAAAPPGRADGTPPPAGTGAPSAPVTGRHGKPYNPTDEQLAAADRASRTEVFSTTDANGSVGGGNSGSSDSASDSSTYTVGSGDSLAGIAGAHHVDGGWRALYDANHRLIGDDPNLIKPGQILNLV
ncbi:transglycosylase family protein [Streptomyces sp. V4-01]|uniref:Transglycosylase family protein n=1 Tax=Actinacidiphila polyblastidii TaxID=3110430 RepID=A0ABU7PER9_9ACTN|nr:transglycosylase family protein [Streptomyces sp. V4-01]